MEENYEDPPGTLSEERVTAGIYGAVIAVGALTVMGAVPWVIGAVAVLFGILTWFKFH